MHRQQRAAAFQFTLQKRQALLLRPLGIATQTEVIGDLAEGFGMPAGVLANVQPHQKQPEYRGTAQAVEQVAIGDHAHAAFVQRLIAKLQRLPQGLVVLQHLCAWLARLAQGLLGPAAGGAQSFAQVFQQAAVRLRLFTHTGAQGRAGALHRQVADQLVDIPQVEVGGHPARQQQYFATDRCGHIGIAVAVATDPGGETHRRRVQRQVQTGAGVQGFIHSAHEGRHRLPERVLDDRESPLGLVHRRRALAADFLGMPGLRHQAPEALANGCAFGVGQVQMIAGGQFGCDGVVLLDQGAPGHFRRMGRQHQLDVQAAQLARQGRRGQAAALETLQQLAEQRRTGGLRLVRPPSPHPVILLGDVGQVEELVERPRDREYLGMAKLVQAALQLPGAIDRTAARSLGTGADTFDLLQQGVTQIAPDGFPEQLPQLAYILPQSCVYLGHGHPSRFELAEGIARPFP